MYNICQLTLGDLSSNCYIVSDSIRKTALIIDPADAPEYIGEKLLEMNLTPVAMIATHGHVDHVLASFGLQVFFPTLPFFIHSNDMFLLKRMQKTAKYFGIDHHAPPQPNRILDILEFKGSLVGREDIQILELPGHTPGSIGVYIRESESVFVGDLIFSDGSVGDTHHIYSDTQKLRKSIAKIKKLPSKTKVYSGHGSMALVGNLSFNGVY